MKKDHCEGKDDLTSVVCRVNVVGGVVLWACAEVHQLLVPWVHRKSVEGDHCGNVDWLPVTSLMAKESAVPLLSLENASVMRFLEM